MVENYRKIYEQHHGSVPRESDGRSYEIHHINGDTTDNSPENLIALTALEHYNIHLAQGDYAACVLIAVKMKMSPQKLSELARLGALKRVANVTNPFLGGKIQSKTAQRLISSGTHNFLANHTCPHCQKEGYGAVMFRWHFDNCKQQVA